ncbi:MAG: formate dehydrogenase accessory sulfurtransferase FdhD [Nitrospirota bacterium]|nr:formate dehydrogenase accessory sulfurtransferase FdhD [Nitrospirota bacterium]MDH5768127.1 formate dehydrogenase accessory sulfurtransferase FdhD [Nitrospirota bacterium]
MDPYIKRKILKKHGTSFEEIEDYIAIEKKLIVSVNGKEMISLYCTPSMIKELVTGFFLTEGIFTDKFLMDKMKIVYGEEVMIDIPVDKDIFKEGMVPSRCLGGVTLNKEMNYEKVIDDFSITAESLKTIFNEYHRKSELFKLTGCFHSAALSDGERILVFADDIGRHNVVDKVIGYSILEDIPLSKKLMLVSCRLSSEIVSKCSRFGVSIIASRAAPTSLAIDISEACGITLVGFMRGDRMNVYTHTQRIIQ